MKSLNNPVVTLALLGAAVALLFTTVVPAAVDAHTAAQVAQQYADRAAKKDANLRAHCAAGHTGVVLYYKGVDCTAN